LVVAQWRSSCHGVAISIIHFHFRLGAQRIYSAEGARSFEDQLAKREAN
jgi:hypothetical protein